MILTVIIRSRHDIGGDGGVNGEAKTALPYSKTALLL
jgi:hypothetical protein